MGKPGSLAVLLFILCVASLSGPIEAQWRGSQRDGIYPGENLLDVWPQAGPECLWFVEGIERDSRRLP